MNNQYITIEDRQFCLSAEPRENHPGLCKAVLSEKLDGGYQKINVWKPGMDTPKVSFALSSAPEEIFEIFEVYKTKIETEERRLGIADY